MTKHQKPDLKPAPKVSGSSKPKKKRKPRITSHTVKTRERHRKAVDLKADGLTHQQIADELGYANRGTVSRVIGNTMQRADVVAVAKLVTKGIEILDAHASLALGDEKAKKKPLVRHANVYFKGLATLARITGAEAPKKHDHTVLQPGDLENMNDEQLAIFYRTGDLAAAMASGRVARDATPGEGEDAQEAGEETPEVE